MNFEHESFHNIKQIYVVDESPYFKSFEKIIEDLNAKKARLYGNPSDSMWIQIFKIEQWLQHRHPGYCQNYEGWGTWEIKKIERD